MDSLVRPRMWTNQQAWPVKFSDFLRLGFKLQLTLVKLHYIWFCLSGKCLLWFTAVRNLFLVYFYGKTKAYDILGGGWNCFILVMRLYLGKNGWCEWAVSERKLFAFFNIWYHYILHAARRIWYNITFFYICFLACFMLFVLLNCSLSMICMLLLALSPKELLCLLFCWERYERIVNICFVKSILSSSSSLSDFITCCIFQSKNALLSTFLFLDQIVWLGRSGIYKVWTAHPYIHFGYSLLDSVTVIVSILIE